MKLFKKDWSAEESDCWTVHDFVASVLGVSAYLLVTVGIIGAFLLQLWGFICIGVALIFTWIMIRVIDPKLKAMSRAFEKRQESYLDKLEKTIRWE